jgi:elongation factor G
MADMVETLRTIALVGHGDSGKTSLAEIMLYKGGATKRLGRVEDGNTAMDFEPEELKRGITISSGFHQFGWKKHRVNLIDTPGDQNFFSDTRMSMQAADGVILLIDAVEGIKVQAEQAWEFAAEFNQPCLIFINKLDRERSDFDKIFSEAGEIFEPKPIRTQIPIGAEADLNGVVDLITMKACTWDENGKMSVGEIPEALREEAESSKEALVEDIAEADDALLERYLEGESLSDEEVGAALRKGILSRTFAPVLCGSAIKGIGIEPLMDFIVALMPSPADSGSRIGVHPDTGAEVERQPVPDAPFSAYVFKTVADPYAGRLSIFRIVSGTPGGDGNFYNSTEETRERYSQLLRLAGKEQKPLDDAGPGDIVAVAKLKETTTGDTLCVESDKVRFTCAEPLASVISYAVTAKEKGEEDKVFTSLTKLLEEDPGLKLTRNAETKEILLAGMGQVHIEATLEKLKRKFNVDVQLKIPKVPYRETVKKKVRVQGKHKKQTGGHGQYGDCWIQIEPLPRGEGFEFVDAIVGGVIPRQFIPAVEKGIQEARVKGVLAGYPCVDFKVTLDDGSFHAVDSSEMAFKIAGSLAFKKATEQANPVLLEPIMKVTVITPDEYTGDIMGDLNGKRGRVLGMDNKGKNQVVIANVPMSEFLTYAPDLRSMTGGRGMFTLEFSHYDEVPAHMAEKIIEEAKKESS